MLLALPHELQILVIENLDAYEIFCLQLTCKDLRNVIENSGRSIWRSCLDRYCTRNSLFKPSFSNLTAVSDFKRAATASLRFARAHRMAAASGDNQEISQRRTRLKFPRDELPQIERNINEVYLVPGGRFLFTFNESAFHIWDIMDAPQSTLVHKQAVRGMEYVAYTNLVANERIHLLYEIDSTWPAGYTPNVPDDGVRDTVTTSEFLELRLDGQEWNSKHHGRFTLIHPEECSADAFSHIDDKILMLIDGITVAWNYLNNTYAAWKLGGNATTPIEIFTNSEYAMYITNEGVYGVRFPEFEPILKGYVVLSKAMAAILPVFSFHHEAVYDLDPTSDLIPIHAFGPDICLPIDGDHPFIYDVRQKASKAEASIELAKRIAELELPPHIVESIQEYISSGYQFAQPEVQPLTYTDHIARQIEEQYVSSIATGNFTVSRIGSSNSTGPYSFPSSQPENAMHVHRYRFSFNPADPTKSTLERVSSQAAVTRGYPTNPGDVLFANYHEKCDGSTATLWRESLWDERDEVNRKTALLLSMSEVPVGPLPTERGKGTSEGNGNEVVLGELQLVPLLDLHLEGYQITPDGPYPGDCMVDAASARAVVLWTNDEEVAYVDVIDIE